MAALSLGSLCTGCAGLDLAVMTALGAELAFAADSGSAPAKFLAHRVPGVPNLGDITSVDWEEITPPDVLTAGFPCQPVSVAGRKRGEDDDRWIWPHVARAVRVLRPRLVVLENVSAIRSGGIGRVVGDLAAVGYVGQYVCLPASAAGAPHRRARWFAAAYPAGSRWPGAAGNLAEAQRGSSGGTAEGIIGHPAGNGSPDAGFPWGDHAPAIQRWERVTGYRAPWPLGADGWMRPAFPEWMMGLPPGWVTGVPGLSDSEQHALIGNAVVPQQAQMALDRLLRPAHLDAA